MPFAAKRGMVGLLHEMSIPCMLCRALMHLGVNVGLHCSKKIQLSVFIKLLSLSLKLFISNVQTIINITS